MIDDLQYIEEPVQDTRDLAAFFGQTRIPMALDETLDEAFSGQGLFRYSSALGPEQRLQQQFDALACLLHQHVPEVHLCKLLVIAGGKTTGSTA